MKTGTGKALQSLDARQAGLVHRAAGHDHEIRREPAGTGLQPPEPPVRVPDGLFQLVIQTDERQDAELRRDRPAIVPDLCLGRKEAAPARVRRKGIGIEGRGDVAGAVRIGIVAPDPADLARLFQKLEGDPGLAQPDRGTDTGETGADHDHPDMFAPGCRLRPDAVGLVRPGR